MTKTDIRKRLKLVKLKKEMLYSMNAFQWSSLSRLLGRNYPSTLGDKVKLLNQHYKSETKN